VVPHKNNKNCHHSKTIYPRLTSQEECDEKIEIKKNKKKLNKNYIQPNIEKLKIR